MLVDSLLMMMTGGWGGGELAKKVSLCSQDWDDRIQIISVKAFANCFSEKKIRASKSDLENWKCGGRALGTRPLPQIKPDFCFNWIRPNTKTFSKNLTLEPPNNELTALQVFHPTGHAPAATTGTLKPHGDMNAATNTTVDCCGGICSSSSRGMATAIHPGCHHPWSQGTPWVPDLVELQLSVSPLQMTHLGRCTSVLEQNQGSATKHPNPQGLISQIFLLGYNPKAGQEVPPPQVNHLQTSFNG